jgi:hypothetical protein
MKTKLPSGHGWAYLGVVLGLMASVAGNIASTVLTESVVSLWLRVPLAALWTVFLGIGIEVLTRIEWERNWRHWGARAILIGPMSLVAGFMSYLHLHHLMVLSGEPGAAQAVGPLAVDGTLFGCTVALLVTRYSARNAGQERPTTTLAQRVANLKAAGSAVLDAAKAPALPAVPVLPEGFVTAPAMSQVPLGPEAPVLEEIQVPADEVPVPVSPAAPRAPRTLRTQWDVLKAVHILMDPEDTRTDAAIGDLVGVGSKMIQRTRRAVRALKADPKATIPTDWKVPAPVIQVIRAEVSR